MTPEQARLYARYYERLYGNYLKKEVECALGLKTHSPNAYILDVGCGPGIQLQRLQEQLPEATLLGLDNSPDMVEAAQKRKVTALLCDITGDTLPDHLPELDRRPLILLCLGNTLALVPPADYHLVASFLARLLVQLEAESATLYVEVRDGTTYRQFIDKGRVEELAYSHPEEGARLPETVLCVQTLTPAPAHTTSRSATYRVEIVCFYVAGTKLELYRVEEPTAYFVDIRAFEDALSAQFGVERMKKLDALSGLTHGAVYSRTLPGKRKGT